MRDTYETSYFYILREVNFRGLFPTIREQTFHNQILFFVTNVMAFANLKLHKGGRDIDCLLHIRAAGHPPGTYNCTKKPKKGDVLSLIRGVKRRDCLGALA